MSGLDWCVDRDMRLAVERGSEDINSSDGRLMDCCPVFIGVGEDDGGGLVDFERGILGVVCSNGSARFELRVATG